MKICKKCNLEYDDSVSFCGHCGSALVPEVEASFCPYCGKELDNEYSFCPYCGQNLAEDAITTINETNFETKVIKNDSMLQNNQKSNTLTNTDDDLKQNHSHQILRLFGSLICGIFAILSIAMSHSVIKGAVRRNPLTHAAPEGYTPEAITALIATILMFVAFCLLFEIIQKKSGKYILYAILYLVASVTIFNIMGNIGMIISVIVGIYFLFKYK